MDGACNQLFACSCFTGDEHRRITRCDFGDARENTLQSGGCSNDLFKHRGFVDFFAQCDIFAPKPVFRPLAVVDVRPRNIPTCNLSQFVAQWVKTSQEPAITSIAFAYSQLHLVRGATSDGTIKENVDPLVVNRMNADVMAIRPLPLFKGKADVIEHNAVGVKAIPVGPENRKNLRRQVQNLPELHFTSAPFLFCSFALGDVDYSAHKFNEIAMRAQNRMTYDVNVPDRAIRMHDAVVRLPFCLLSDRRLG